MLRNRNPTGHDTSIRNTDVEQNVQKLADAIAQVQEAWDSLGFDKHFLFEIERERIYSSDEKNEPNPWSVKISRYDDRHNNTLQLEAKDKDVGVAFEQIRPVLTFVANGGIARTFP